MDNKLSFIKNVFSFSLLTYISFLLSFLSAPISTRIYPPEQMGIINMFSTYAALITSLAYLGLDQAYVRFYNEPPDGKSSKTLLTFCTGVTSSFVLLLGVVVLAFGEDVSEIVVGRADGIIPICLVIAAISGVCIRFLNLNYRMKQRALMYTIQGVCLVFFNKILYVVVGFWNPTYKYAIISMTSLQFMLAIVFVFIQKREFQFKNIKVSKRFITSIAGFAVPLIPITFLSWANNSLSQIVLKHYLDFTALGIYSSAVGIASMINVVQSGFNTYWAPYVYKNYEKKDNKFWTVHKVITTLLVLCGLVIIFAQDIIFILLGESYRSSKTFFPFLLVSPICYTITETTGLGINISKKTFWNSIIFCVNVISNLTFSIILIPAVWRGRRGFCFSVVCGYIL